MPNPTLRLFIAVPIPEPIRAAVLRAQAELRAAVAEKSLRWTRAGQFHVTLRFLGNVDDRRVDALTAAVGRACDGFGALQLRAAGIGMFPNPRRPRVVWVGVAEQRERLAMLQRVIETASAEFTNEKPEQTFTGHVTLGRCQACGRKEIVRLVALTREMEKRVFGEWTASGIEIVRSELGPRGSRHTTLAAVPL